jgi:hypothetical protein
VYVDDSGSERLKCVEEINEKISKFAHSFKKVILLIDRFIDNPLEESFNRLDPTAKTMAIKDPIFGSAEYRAPLLAELDYSVQGHVEILKHSITLGLERSAAGSGAPRVCAWLFTNSALKEIHAEVQQRLNVRYPSGEKIYLRYFDPRVMTQLKRILKRKSNAKDSSDFFDLLGSVNIWCHLSLDGKLESYENEKAYLSHFRGNLKFEKNTAAAIDRISLVNQSILELLNYGGKYTAGNDIEIDLKLVEAEKYGIAKNDDKISYAKWTFINPGKFSNYAEIKSLIDEALIKGIPLETVFLMHCKLCLGIA